MSEQTQSAHTLPPQSGYPSESAGQKPRDSTASGVNTPTTATVADSGSGNFRLSNLDSLFYIICALAGLGLVISMYALITQNNTFVDKEFELLQRETAALNARLSQVDGALVSAGADNEKHSVTAAQPNVIASHPGEPSGDAIAADVVDSDTAEDRVAAVTPDPASPPTELDALRAELDGLRSALDAQSSQIQLLIELNQSLRDLSETDSDRRVQTVEDNIGLSKPVEDVLSGESTDDVNHTDVYASIAIEPDPTRIMNHIEGEARMPLVELGASKSSTTDMVSEAVTVSAIEPVAGGSRSEVDDRLHEAYRAYRVKQYDQALAEYDAALDFDPYHRAANLGAAASAYQLRKYTQAAQVYRHLLSLDPLDRSAFAGLLNIAMIDPDQRIIELELQQHAQQHGNPVSLNALLGDHFARRGRWRDAEAAFAVTLQDETSNADLLFNYAVVLDNLGHDDRAARYYQSALEASSRSEFSFDIEGAKRRLQSLTTG